MNIEDKEYVTEFVGHDVVREALKAMVGQKFSYICRCCDMVNFGFGDDVYAGKNRKGEDRYSPAYCVHVLSPFRITKGNAVILSTNDYNYSYDGEWTHPDIGEKNNCLYDSRAKKLIKEYSDEVIEKVTLTEYGDLIIDTANLSFSAFNLTSQADDEAWRVMSMIDGVHYVCEADRIRKEYYI